MPNKGFKHSEETKRRMSKSHMGKPKPWIVIPIKRRILDGCDRSGGNDNCWLWIKSIFKDSEYGQN